MINSFEERNYGVHLERTNSQMQSNKIKKYWDERAIKLRGTLSTTTNDVWLRNIEVSLLMAQLKNFSQISSVLDIGCGDGNTIITLAKNFPTINFVGIDYSEKMVQNAKEKLSIESLDNRVKFIVSDVLDLSKNIGKFDAVISDRCLINLPSRDLQSKAIKNIHSVLNSRGVYFAIENFIEGHKEFNIQRKKLGLQEIPVRWHNNFFSESWFLSFIKNLFDTVEEIKFASTYYLVTRVVFSKLCRLQKTEPSYEHPIYEIASQLDSVGDFAPMRFYLLKKAVEGNHEFI